MDSRLTTGEKSFIRTVMRYWRAHGRHDLPWRKTADPYHILVSEIMLQQTQVPRVIDKYTQFLAAFPSFRMLSRATPARVLNVWQGLGYNRRALMLLQCAKAVVKQYHAVLPEEYEALISLPGIGPYTAGAIMAFAFDRAIPMIETNIRRVYIHHFFPRRRSVSDTQILPLVTSHVGHVRSARVWYSALMDYGSWLATQLPNPNTRSKHYVKQSAFEGSQRQLRGAIVRLLTNHPKMTTSAIVKETGRTRSDVGVVMAGLMREGFIAPCSHTWCVHNPHWSLR